KHKQDWDVETYVEDEETRVYFEPSPEPANAANAPTHLEPVRIHAAEVPTQLETALREPPLELDSVDEQSADALPAVEYEPVKYQLEAGAPPIVAYAPLMQPNRYPAIAMRIEPAAPAH